MKQSSTCTIGEECYTVAELTVGEIDAVIGSIKGDSPLHRTYNVLGFDLTPEFVAVSANIPREAHQDLSVEDLETLVAKVEEVNASFLERVRAVAKGKNAEAAA